jgi:hypothetical protein
MPNKDTSSSNNEIIEMKPFVANMEFTSAGKRRGDVFAGVGSRQKGDR